MPSNRSVGRNVHIFDAQDRTTVLGGLILTKGITNKNFYEMIEILRIPQAPLLLQDEVGAEVQRNDDPLQPGNYYVAGKFQLHLIKPLLNDTGSFLVNNELWLTRTISTNTGTRQQAFCDAVRLRDGRCVVSGKKALGAYKDNWTSFEAAHIFPLAYEGHWAEYNFSRWITLPPTIGSAINSVQNGMLLRSDIHQLFDSYLFSINPDDGYKVVCFDDDNEGIAGTYIDQRLFHSPERPADELLRWHHRQAVLANMRGAGEPIFEHDFPPGSDMMGQILEGPKAAERMEFELHSRLALYTRSF